MPLWCDCGGLRGGVTAQDARQGPQSGNAAPFRGFRTFGVVPRIGAIGRVYAPLVRLRGIARGVAAVAAVRMDCRVVPAGSSGVAGGSAW